MRKSCFFGWLAKFIRSVVYVGREVSKLGRRFEKKSHWGAPGWLSKHVGWFGLAWKSFMSSEQVPNGYLTLHANIFMSLCEQAGGDWHIACARRVGWDRTRLGCRITINLTDEKVAKFQYLSIDISFASFWQTVKENSSKYYMSFVFDYIRLEFSKLFKTCAEFGKRQNIKKVAKFEYQLHHSN
jgi:hypothetical protein